MPFIKLGFIITLAIIILLLFIVTGCGGYKVFILADIVPTSYLVANFSIEYPSRYESLFVHYASIERASVTSSPPGTEIFIIPDISLEVYIFKPSGDSVQNYRELLENNLSYARAQSASEFKLNERSPITVDGVQGERVVYYYIREAIPDICESVRAVSCSAYLENNSYFWIISVNAISEKAEQAQEELEHIVRTFKFLE